MQAIILIHCEKSAFMQGFDRMANTGFGNLHVSGKINGTDHALLLLKNQHSLQIILPGRMNFHSLTSSS